MKTQKKLVIIKLLKYQQMNFKIFNKLHILTYLKTKLKCFFPYLWNIVLKLFQEHFETEYIRTFLSVLKDKHNISYLNEYILIQKIISFNNFTRT